LLWETLKILTLPGLSLWHVLRHVLSGFTGRGSLRLAINLLCSLRIRNVSQIVGIQTHTLTQRGRLGENMLHRWVIRLQS